MGLSVAEGGLVAVGEPVPRPAEPVLAARPVLPPWRGRLLDGRDVVKMAGLARSLDGGLVLARKLFGAFVVRVGWVVGTSVGVGDLLVDVPRRRPGEDLARVRVSRFSPSLMLKPWRLDGGLILARKVLGAFFGEGVGRVGSRLGLRDPWDILILEGSRVRRLWGLVDRHVLKLSRSMTKSIIDSDFIFAMNSCLTRVWLESNMGRWGCCSGLRRSADTEGEWRAKTLCSAYWFVR